VQFRVEMKFIQDASHERTEGMHVFDRSPFVHATTYVFLNDLIDLLLRMHG
jgi:hypothetical protein